MRLNHKTVLKAILGLIYLIGTACVIVFSIMFLNHSTHVPYPDAMIPMMQYEVAGCRLVFGFPFMLASCISMIAVHKIKQIKKIICVFIPAIICLIMCVIIFI